MKARAYKDLKHADQYWIVFEDSSVLSYCYPLCPHDRRNNWLDKMFFSVNFWKCKNKAITHMFKQEIDYRRGDNLAYFEIPDVLHSELHVRAYDCMFSSAALFCRRLGTQFLDAKTTLLQDLESEQIVEQKEKEFNDTIRDIHGYLESSLKR